MARLLTAVLFWPAMVCATGAMALVLTFLLAGHATPIGTVALVLAAGAAGLFGAVRSYRWRTPPLDAMRSAVCAVLMLGTAANLPVGVAAFSPAGIHDVQVIVSLALATVGQVAAFAAFRWSLAERQTDGP